MHRHRAPLAVVIFALVAVATSAAGREDRSADEKALRHLKEVEWPRAYREQDVALLDRILADEFQMVDADGNWSTKAEELDWVRKNKPSYDSFRFVIRRLDLFENGSAVVAGTGVIQSRDEQGPYVMEYQSSNVLIRRDGRWQAIASHVSGIKRKGI
ncbi:MAG TPA: nuclear transport factor 2 family protein [Thermoanaerobaculia bacterium]|nr:nuclear transport factor 2 family protein [Thermoanaerobaculia bacterium]